MKIAVCIKQVPDSESRLRIAGHGRWIEEEEVQFVINESDEYALEEALILAEKTQGEVVVFSLGPERVREALRKALALGASRAVHLSHTAFQSGDCLTNGRALAAAIQQEDFDLVLTGSQSDDLGYGSTGSIIAGQLGWPHAWLVMGIEVDEDGRGAKVTREMEAGLNELFHLELPAVLQVQAGISKLRYASLKGIMQAKKKEISEVGPDDLGLSAQEVGEAGAGLETVSVAFPETGQAAQIIDGEPAEAARILVGKLRKEARVL